jgi:hypothetical protein
MILVLTVCLLAGSGVAAEWTGRHPKWRVVRWACRPPEVRA